MLLQLRVRGGPKISNQDHTQSEYEGESGLKNAQKIETTFFPFCFQKPDYIYTLNCNKNFDTKCYSHGHLLTYGY